MEVIIKAKDVVEFNIANVTQSAATCCRGSV